jgi:sialate O-acetylesterase
MLKTLSLCLLVGALAAADLRFAHVFQDHMVLQTGELCPVWGWADPGATVTLRCGQHEHNATADAGGRWRVDLKNLAVSSEPLTLTATVGDQVLTLNDILVGEVWLCTGQSNMARNLTTEMSQNPELAARVGDRDFPAIRFMNVPGYAAAEPLSDFDPVAQGNSHWTVCSADTAGSSMASPFFFARALHQALGKPIGLVQVAVSGTTQTAWTAREVLDARAAADPKDPLSYAEAFKRAEAGLQRNKSEFADWSAYLAADAAWHAEPKGRWPGGLSIANFPSVLYHTQIHPLAPLAFRGLLWNQGEGGPSQQYGERLYAMMQQWRELFGHEFHAIFSSLGRSTTAGPPLEPTVSTFYRSAVNLELNDAQRLFGPSGSWCDIADLGNTDTHWGRKDEAGERYAKAALDAVYHQPQVFTGPQVIEHTITAGSIRLRFARVGGGLVYTPSIDGISGFVLQIGDEASWIEPTVTANDTLTFTDSRITADARISYGCFPNPHETLSNKEGFNAAIFSVGSGDFRASREKPSLTLASITASSDPKAKLHIAQVRASAYVIMPQQAKGSGTVTVNLYVPKAWPTVVISQQGKTLTTNAETTDAAGNRFFSVTLTTNEGSAIIAASDASPEALAEAQRGSERF